MQIFQRKLDEVFDKIILFAGRRERCIKPYLIMIILQGMEINGFQRLNIEH